MVQFPYFDEFKQKMNMLFHGLKLPTGENISSADYGAPSQIQSLK
jgi:hypothetical protein